MAVITTGVSQVYAGTEATSSKIVGRNGGKNYVARYSFVTPPTGANTVSWELQENYTGEGTRPALRWALTTDATSHVDAGPASEYHGTVTATAYGGSYIFSGSADLVLLPSTTYYLWIFPNTTTYGFYWLKQSGTATMTTAGAARSIMSLSGTLTLGNTVTVKVTRYADVLSHVVTYTCGKASGTVKSKTTSESFTWTAPMELAEQNLTGTTVQVNFTITTYNGSQLIGSTSSTYTFSIPASAKPSCTLSVTDAMGLAESYDGYVKGISKFKVVITPTLSYKSPIASYRTTANGAIYTAASFTTEVLASSGTLTVATTITDKRGRTASASVDDLVVLPYTAPKISKLTVHRCGEDGTEDEQGDHIRVDFAVAVSNLNDHNSALYTVSYKSSADERYTDVPQDDYAGQYSVTDGRYIFPADTGLSYSIKLTVTDDFNTETRTTNASTASTVLHFHEAGNALGIGKMVEEENLLDVKWPVRFQEALGIESGGTGATTAEEARANLGAAANFVTIEATGENLDDYTTAGWYYFRNAPTNIPGGSNGWLHVMTAPSLAIAKQVWYRYGTPGSNDYQTWVRTKNTAANGGTWGKWWRYAVIDEAVFTTREVALTIADQTNYDMTTIAAYSRSGIVDVHINTKPATVSSSWLTIATLPSGYRPPTNIYKVESYYNSGSNYANLRMRIHTNGSVQLCLGTAGANYAFHATFIMA